MLHTNTWTNPRPKPLSSAQPSLPNSQQSQSNPQPRNPIHPLPQPLPHPLLLHLTRKPAILIFISNATRHLPALASSVLPSTAPSSPNPPKPKNHPFQISQTSPPKKPPNQPPTIPSVARCPDGELHARRMNVGTIDTNFSCAWSFIALAIAISISVPGTILNKGNTYVVSADVMCAFFF